MSSLLQSSKVRPLNFICVFVKSEFKPPVLLHVHVTVVLTHCSFFIVDVFCYKAKIVHQTRDVIHSYLKVC